MSRRIALLGVGSLVLAACAQPAPGNLESVDPTVHAARVREWRQWRHDELTRSDGWLSLAGLYWLHEGDNTFGADASADLVVTAAEAPVHLGVFTLQQGTVRFRADASVTVTVGEEPVRETIAHTGVDGDAHPVFQSGTLSWFVIERGDRLGVRLKDTRNPALLGFSGVDNYAIAPQWRLVGHFEPHDPVRTIKVPNVLGMLNDVESPGAAVFEVAGDTYRLDLWRDEPEDLDWFTAFGDSTNADTTYGGGRFIRIDPPDEAGRLVVDFNRAYNPPCAFTAFATCPLPPQQNRLVLRIEAGELAFASH